MQLSFASFLALLSAVLTASATIFIRQGLQHSNSYTGYWINLVVGVAGLWIAVFIFTPEDVVFSRAIPIFALSGLVGTIGGRFTRFVAIDSGSLYCRRHQQS